MNHSGDIAVDSLEVPEELINLDYSSTSAQFDDTNPAPPLFAGSNYPTQFEEPDLRFVAELRGAYANDRWRPSSSRFGNTRNNGQTFHSGVDIYAPVGTAVLAMAAGRAEMKPMSGDDKIGHRVWLHTSIGGQDFRLIYGHLDGFEGSSRTVEAGDVIGYVGCSGNADYGGICSNNNRCGFSASHIHLIAFRNDDMRFDPSRLLNLPLRYSNDDRDILCTQLAN